MTETGNDAFNQSPPFVDVDLHALDRPLQDALAANGVADEAAALSAFGRHWGSAVMAEQARLANLHPPELKIRGAAGDIVVFHPAYHDFMRESMAAGLHAMTWGPSGESQSNEVRRAARFYMVAQVENGHMCPITMTRASVAALAAEPALRAALLPKICGRDYDETFRPWPQKSAITLGMGMTERQGGTDVRTNTTRAIPDGDAYRITGEKWFMSAPMCDGFLVLAQAPGGLTCFFMPRFRPDGSPNAMHFVRLKDKLGNRSNASTEVQFSDAFAQRVGEEGRGVRTILQMVQLTRLDCAISSAGIMRMALAQALHHARHRIVFQKKLIDQPMMENVLADMALEVEGMVALVMRLCRAMDATADPAEAARARLLTPVVKYFVCKSAPGFVYEAMECLGGNGYVEDSILPRLYREAPVNAIWEGSGNVMALDMLRSLARDPDSHAVIAALTAELKIWPAGGELLRAVGESLQRPDAEAEARFAVEALARCGALAALAESAPDVAALYAQARFGAGSGRNYGIVRLDNSRRLLDRALPDF
ncbi:MAG: acyl-CoA dehydrogenase family protein [Pseudorhodoplanes sp.]